MSRQPIAFLSYVRSDDDHDEGRITAFRKRLEGEVRMQTGEPFAIFQDRNDITWGQQWEERINTSLADVTFLIPVVTPSFFRSPACRSEFNTFARKEKLLGENQLILPLYYVACDQLGSGYTTGSDEIADILRMRNWTDWRQFRFKKFGEEPVAAAIAELAATIKNSIGELKAIGDIPRAKRTTTQEAPPESQFPEILTEEEILSSDVLPSEANSEPTAQDVPDYATCTSATVYHAFTRAYDEIVEAGELADEIEVAKLHRYIASFSRAFRKIHQPALKAFLAQFTLKQDVAPLSVSILIDNSGSMRGAKIVHTAAWCHLIAEWMDKLGISTEFLGFTTRTWKGGQSREAWLAAGKPKNPGRLNDLRHLVYKSFSASAAAATPNFSVMAREGLLKENIDGEAILWAASRLEQHASPNKLLFVFSDGAPVDDSTLSANPANYLEKHLQSVIDSLSERISLHAIGIGTDVSRYYPNAISTTNTSEIGPLFFEALVNDKTFQLCFTSKRPKTRYRYPDASE
ncbi:Aerobic cobaltochelatase CobT subunit EC 6612 [Bradyrhizobium sp.]|nr:TIR domain-containing protein [Bradyrhizobium sp.]CUT13910.1 Aerobic cobaltochelatase CobT subunit EC 6612 [Bradyrhizobium sp.]